MDKYAEMSKYDLISKCIKKDSTIERLQWELDSEKKSHLLSQGLCPLKRKLDDKIIACVFNCEDCYIRREREA